MCQDSAPRILNDFTPNLMIAIGGGGYVPARILRSFLKKPGSPNIPIQAIGLSLYESLGTADETQVEAPGTKVTRTQWLDLRSLEMANLIGKSVLIVDEVDDTRTTLEYAVKELEKDVALAAKEAGREAEETKFSIFVLHNKDKAKKGLLPGKMMKEERYLAARTVPDVWINYPWEATYVIPSPPCGGGGRGKGFVADCSAGTSTSMIRWRSSRRSNRICDPIRMTRVSRGAGTIQRRATIPSAWTTRASGVSTLRSETAYLHTPAHFDIPHYENACPAQRPIILRGFQVTTIAIRSE